MYHLIRADEKGNQFYLNVDTLEVAKINRKMQKSTQFKGLQTITVFGIISFVTTMVRIVTFDMSTNKVMLLLFVYSIATILGLGLAFLIRIKLTKELSQNKIEYSIRELKYWVETGKMNPKEMLQFCALFFTMAAVISIIYYVDPTHILMLPIIFICWFALCVALLEPCLYYFRNRKKLMKIYKDNDINYLGDEN